MKDNTINTSRLKITPISPIDQVITDDFLGNTPANNPTGNIPMAIMTRDEEAYVGTILLNVNNDNEAEIELDMEEPYKQKDFHREATQAIIKYAFEHLALNRIVAVKYQPPTDADATLISMGLTRIAHEDDKSTYDILRHEYIYDE